MTLIPWSPPPDHLSVIYAGQLDPLNPSPLIAVLSIHDVLFKLRGFVEVGGGEEFLHLSNKDSIHRCTGQISWISSDLSLLIIFIIWLIPIKVYFS